MSTTLEEHKTVAPVIDHLLKECDREIAEAHKIAEATRMNQDKWGDKRLDNLDSAYSRAGFAQSARNTLATIVGNGIHAHAADSDIVARYDGWAMVAQSAGEHELAAALRDYVTANDGRDGMLVSEAVAYLTRVRAIIASHA